LGKVIETLAIHTSRLPVPLALVIGSVLSELTSFLLPGAVVEIVRTE
jgi:hypothetical protein